MQYSRNKKNMLTLQKQNKKIFVIKIIWDRKYPQIIIIRIMGIKIIFLYFQFIFCSYS